MPLDTVILILRIAIVLVLYAFLAMLAVFLWRDMRTANWRFQDSHRALGRLIVIRSDGLPLEVGREYPLRPVTTLGRGPTNVVVLPDTFASVEHAQITLSKGQWWLEDRQSRNGTTLNGVPITGVVVLSSGDEIGIGRVCLRFEPG